MPSAGRAWLVAVLALFAWAMITLLDARFEAGDQFPEGSSLRSDALGLRAIHDAIAESLPRRVTRHRGRSGELANATDATIVVQRLSFAQLVAKQDPLINELTQAARSGARVLVSLDDRESNSCNLTYCNESERTRCAPPGPSAVPTSATTANCADAAIGLWGFEIGGSGSKTPLGATRTAAAPASLPEELPWHTPAVFIELGPEYKVVYSRKSGAVVVERPLGKGSLVLLAEGYLLSNEAQRNARFPELLLWILGDKSRVIFEESHLGVLEPRGIVSLARELGLHGFFAGCLVLALLLAWQRLSPLARTRPRSPRRAGDQSASESTLLSILRRSMTPEQAFEACVEQAGHAGFGAIVERAASRRCSSCTEEWNRVVCPEHERSNPQ